MNEDEEQVSLDTNPDALEAALGDDFIDEDDEDLFHKKKIVDGEEEDGVIVAYDDSSDNPFDLI